MRYFVTLIHCFVHYYHGFRLSERKYEGLVEGPVLVGVWGQSHLKSSPVIKMLELNALPRTPS